MKPAELILLIERLGSRPGLTFTAKCEAAASAVFKLSRGDLLQHLDEAGVIPERFGHDSSEEKVFAKYCDALLTRALRELGMSAELIEERADSADVVASYGRYKLVADAKAFRLSRTAKNQKDFKVEALNQWRKGANYACLVCPLYQYPTSNSQIYHQARGYNVTLLSYTHLAFLIRNPPNTAELIRLWEVSKNSGTGKSAKEYWAAVAALAMDITGTDRRQWDAAVKGASGHLPALADEQVGYWEAERARALGLPAEAARAELIAALKIDNKIAVIRQAVAALVAATETFET